MSREEATELIKQSVAKQFAAKGQDIIAMNLAAVEMAWSGLEEVDVPTHSAQCAAPPSYSARMLMHSLVKSFYLR